MLLLPSAEFFQNYFFQKILSESLLVSNGLNPDQDRHSVFPGFKGYRQTTKIAASKERINIHIFFQRSNLHFTQFNTFSTI